ncbi:MAG: ATP-grasp domain-containing protein [Aureispira sp.]|nr:ATP-grasp domain-containing protein [Aureispira sp.]
MHSTPKNILLTGGRAPATLHLARLFKRQKHKVYIADTFGYNLSGVSKYVDQSFIIPPPRQQPKAFVNQLRILIKDYSIDLLIPTCEETFYVAQYQEAFARYCQVFTSGIKLMEQLHSKWNFNQLLRWLELPYPKSVLTHSRAELNKAVGQFHKFVAKPTYSRFADNVIIDDKKALEDISINHQQSWVVQEFIEGDHFCSFSVVDKGRLTAHSVYPVSYRVGNGAAVYFESIDIPKIKDIITKIIQTTKYTGFLSFDFIKSSKDGQYYTLECNPRLTSGIHLFDAKDAFMPFQKPYGVCYPKPENRMMLTLAILAYSLPEVRSFPAFLKLLKYMTKAEDVVFSWQDLRPFFAQLFTIFHFYRIAKQNNISILDATTHHIEWNGNF